MSEAITVSFTAKVMAAMRALKTQRPDALFRVFFAEQLAGTDAIEDTIFWLEADEKEGKLFVAARTSFFNEL